MMDLFAIYSDLKAHRDAVYRILRRLRHDVVSMEDYVATDAYPLHKCLDDVAACRVCVGLVGWRYGYILDRDNPERKSITELEHTILVSHFRTPNHLARLVSVAVHGHAGAQARVKT